MLQLVEKLDTYLGRSFLLASYLPCLIFAALNLLLAYAEFPDVRGVLAVEYAGVASSKAVDFVVASCAVGVVALALAPLTPPLKLALQGELFGSWITEPLLLGYAVKRDRLRANVKAMQDRRSLLPAAVEHDKIKLRLREIRLLGCETGAIADPEAIRVADAAIGEMRERRLLNRVVEPGLFSSVMTKLSLALQANCADESMLKTPVSPQSLKAAGGLQSIYLEMIDTLLPYTTDIATRSELHQLEDRLRRFADMELAPTQIGNDAAELRGYCDSRYGLDFDFFWPRLLLLVQKDKALADMLVASKAQLDFWVLTLGLTILTIAGWLVTLATLGDSGSLWALLGLAGLAPPLAYLILHLVHAGYGQFSELVRSVIDMRRLDLIEALQFARPDNPAAEKATWEYLTRWLKLGEKQTHGDYARVKPSAQP